MSETLVEFFYRSALRILQEELPRQITLYDSAASSTSPLWHLSSTPILVYKAVHEFSHWLFLVDCLDEQSYYDRHYRRNYYRLASRLSYSPHLEMHLQEALSQTGNTESQNIQRNDFDIFGIYHNINWDDCCCAESIIVVDCFKVPQTHHQPLADQFISYLLYSIACCFIGLLKKLTAEAKRLQYLAHQVCNRISRSPTPQKTEPPVGGVKIGGKQHDFFRHVAEILYLKPIFILNQAAVP